jgi:hypothetical protein
MELLVNVDGQWMPEESVDWNELDRTEINFILVNPQGEAVAQADINNIFGKEVFDTLKEFKIKYAGRYTPQFTIVNFVKVESQYYGRGYGLEILKRIKPYISANVYSVLYSQRILKQMYEVFGIPNSIIVEPGSLVKTPKLLEEMMPYLDQNPVMVRGHDGNWYLDNDRSVRALWVTK